HAQGRRSAAVGAQCRGRISAQSAYGSEGLSRTGRRAIGRDEARPRHVRQCRRAQSSAQGRTQKISRGRMATDRGYHRAVRPDTERTDGCRKAAVVVETCKGGALKPCLV